MIVFLAVAGFAVPLLQRKFSPVLGYLLIGGLIGPYGLGLFATDYPIASYVVIDDLDGVRALAEIGVIFLLFAIGLELSLDRLWSMRRFVFGLGTAQIVLTGMLIGSIAYAWGNSGSAALVLGACLALSSTAIVMQLLIEKGRLTTPVGRSVFSVLLMQDLAVVPILFIVGVLGTVSAGEFAFIVVGLAMALGLVPGPTGQFMLIVASLTMMLTPVLELMARKFGALIEEKEARGAAEQAEATEALEGHVVIGGFGRVGRLIASILDREGLSYIAIDKDPAIAAQARSMGLPVRFGDASRLEVLQAARVRDATALVVTLGDEIPTERLTARMREAAPHVPLFVRARDGDQAERLTNAGATAAVPETIEASLQLAARVLEGCGFDDDVVQRRIQLER